MHSSHRKNERKGDAEKDARVRGDGGAQRSNADGSRDKDRGWDRDRNDGGDRRRRSRNDREEEAGEDRQSGKRLRHADGDGEHSSQGGSAAAAHAVPRQIQQQSQEQSRGPSRARSQPLLPRLLRDVLRCSPNKKSDLRGRVFAPTFSSPWKDPFVPALPSQFNGVEEYKRRWADLLVLEAIESIKSYRGDPQDVSRDRERSGALARIHTAGDRVAGVIARELSRTGPVGSPLDGDTAALRVLLVRVELDVELSEGDVLLLHAEAWTRNALGVVMAGDTDAPLFTAGPRRPGEVSVLVAEDCVARSAGRGGWLAGGGAAEGVAVDMYCVANIVTSLRECRALERVHDSPWRSQLLLAPPPGLSPRRKQAPREPLVAAVARAPSAAASLVVRSEGRPAALRPELWTAMSTEFNPEQLSAIRACMDVSALPPADRPFLLIQGPPGTGKTRTIVGITAAVLAGCKVTPGGHDVIVAGSSLLGKLPSSRLRAVHRDLHHSRALRPHRSERKVLICAPSNTAVDELVHRIRAHGVLDADGKRRLGAELRLVRVGRGGTPGGGGGGGRDWEGSSGIGGGGISGTGGFDPEADVLVDACSLETLTERDKPHFVASEYGASITDLKHCLLEEADVIFCTLSAAGSSLLAELAKRSSKFQIDAVIVDEATQAGELTSLVPLMFRPGLVVLVGDPCQLRPTVISLYARRKGYGISLFERLFRRNYTTLMLKEQYRMHPDIAAYPSERFYGGQLRNSAAVCGRAALDFYGDESGRFAPLVFHDLKGSECRVGKSVANSAEAAYICGLLGELYARYPAAAALEVGVIAPYSAMRDAVRRALQDKFGAAPVMRQLCVATVDGFQGREKDVVIFCCVRSARADSDVPDPDSSAPLVQGEQQAAGAGRGAGFGFTKEKNRMNVALTRARLALWVVGDADHLSGDQEWRALIRHARRRHCLYTSSTPAEKM